MKYLILILIFASTTAHAQFQFNSGISKPQSMVVAGDSVIDSDGSTTTEEAIETSGDFADDTDMIEPIKPIAPTSPSAPVTTKKILKKIAPVKSQRSITDERIDDSYVQDLIKQNFNFTSLKD
jgi:hypothetical protein